MAASELNNRLDYLISYSSQLVFVCSDKIQQQSKVIDSFLAHQNEQTDLALLTANELTPLITYREKLFRQLINQNQLADFNRPLNQLLAPLNNHSGPILINIFQAEKLPNKLVKELWDLVLQSRFANNKQHLNVLLIGPSEWAESAKSGLGARAKEQPIMLNGQIDMLHEENQEFSDLESFIRDKRKKFAQRLEDRCDKTYQSTPIYKKWWVATLFGLTFLAIFSGLLGWQYPGKVQAMVTYIDNWLSTEALAVKPSENVEVKEPVPTITIQTIPITIDEKVTPTELLIDTKIATTDPLVTDWTTASAKLEEQSNKILLQSRNITKPTVSSVPIEKQAKLAEPQTQPAKLDVEKNIDNDYKIEDIYEVGAIPEPQELQLPNIIPSQINSELKTEHNLILALPSENFVIQIAAMANISILQEYVTEERLEQQLWLYKTQRYGGDWYVLLKNQHFSSIQDARAEITYLPETMLRNTPFVKSLRQIKEEIGVSGP